MMLECGINDFCFLFLLLAHLNLHTGFPFLLFIYEEGTFG